MGNQDASAPQNDREYMIQINGNVERLTDRIADLTEAIKDMQQDEIKPIKLELSEVKLWQSRFNGTWKAVIAIGALLSILATLLELKALFGK